MTGLCAVALGEEYNTAAPGYSKFLAKQLHLKRVYGQYGFYGAIAGGTAYLASRFYRAHALIKYQSLKDRPDVTKEAELWADIANVTPHQIARAGRMVRRFHAQGIAAITLAPIMWVAFRWSAGKPSKKPKGK